MKDLYKYVLGVAAKSNVEKRQVGCIIVNSVGEIVAEGFNVETAAYGVVHAEAAACKCLIANAFEYSASGPLKAYVTHPPCPNCAKLLLDHGITDVEVIEEFKKFDGDKVRYDLVPPSTTKALAEVLTFGARKYEPNNWKKCTELWRYEAAMLRHIEAYRSGEILDVDSGLPHLAHAMTNLAFLIELSPKFDENTRQTDAHLIQNK